MAAATKQNTKSNAMISVHQKKPIKAQQKSRNESELVERLRRERDLAEKRARLVELKLELAKKKEK